MSALLVQPQPEVFSSVPLFSQIADEFERENVAARLTVVGKIFVKHGMFKKFGLSMIHRHFDMSPTEILVDTEKKDGTLSVAMPWKFEGSLGEPVEKESWSSYGLEKKSLVVPRNWRFSDTGDLQPFEFETTDDRSSLTGPTLAFANELFLSLRELGVEKFVGVARLRQNNIPAWETTPCGNRTNITHFGKLPEQLENQKMVRVIWYFNGEGMLVGGDDHCSRHCVGHCCGHTVYCSSHDD